MLELRKTIEMIPNVNVHLYLERVPAYKEERPFFMAVLEQDAPLENMRKRTFIKFLDEKDAEEAIQFIGEELIKYLEKQDTLDSSYVIYQWRLFELEKLLKGRFGSRFLSFVAQRNNIPDGDMGGYHEMRLSRENMVFRTIHCPKRGPERKGPSDLKKGDVVRILPREKGGHTIGHGSIGYLLTGRLLIVDHVGEKRISSESAGKGNIILWGSSFENTFFREDVKAVSKKEQAAIRKVLEGGRELWPDLWSAGEEIQLAIDVLRERLSEFWVHDFLGYRTKGSIIAKVVDMLFDYGNMTNEEFDAQHGETVKEIERLVDDLEGKLARLRKEEAKVIKAVMSEKH